MFGFCLCESLEDSLTRVDLIAGRVSEIESYVYTAAGYYDEGRRPPSIYVSFNNIPSKRFTVSKNLESLIRDYINEEKETLRIKTTTNKSGKRKKIN